MILHFIIAKRPCWLQANGGDAIEANIWSQLRPKSQGASWSHEGTVMYIATTLEDNLLVIVQGDMQVYDECHIQPVKVTAMPCESAHQDDSENTLQAKCFYRLI